MQTEKADKRKKYRHLIFPLLALIILLALVLFNKYYLSKPSKRTRGDAVLEGPYKVVRVVDGDTFVIKMDGSETKVRLIGIDAPESVAPESSGKENTDDGKKAAEHLKKMIDGKNIYLEYDLDTYDQYGRLLAYAYLSDQQTMVQEKMLSEGYAQVMTVPPNVKYTEEFTKLQKEAREKGRGLWNIELQIN